MSFNSVILSGRLTADPDVKSTSSGMLVCNFSLAVNDFIKGEEYTSFINCVCFAKTAERMQLYVKKGSLIGVEGNLRQNRWEDSEGNKKNRIEIIVSKLEIFEWKQKDGDSYNKSQSQNQSPQNDYSNQKTDDTDFLEEESDIPF